MHLAWSCSTTQTTVRRYYLSLCDEITAAAGARVTLSQLMLQLKLRHTFWRLTFFKILTRLAGLRLKEFLG